MIRRVAARRLAAVCLLLFIAASPVLAADREPARPAGLVERLIAWVSALWAAPGEVINGGCILDPNGGCRDGAGAPPPIDLTLD